MSQRLEIGFAESAERKFAIDTGRRQITGLAVPWGQSARSSGRRFRFLPSALVYSSVGRVKLLRDHDSSQLLGKAIALTETERGLEATFKVSEGAAGDTALALAADGTLDGLSIGVDFREEDTAPDPDNPGGYIVTRAALREISLTGLPAFDDSRLTSVRASDYHERTGMPEKDTQNAPAPVQFSAEMQEQFVRFMAERASKAPRAGGDAANAAQTRANNESAVEPKASNNAAVHPEQQSTEGRRADEIISDESRLVRPGDLTSSAYVDDKHPAGRTGAAPTWEGRGRDSKPDGESVPPQDHQFSAQELSAQFAAWMARRPTVDPTRGGGRAQVREALPYRFARSGADGEVRFSSASEHNFHSDLYQMARFGDDGGEGGRTDAGKRVMSLIRATFDVDSADVNELSPNVQRPDMFVDQRDYRTPIMDAIGRGNLPGGATPFTFPKFASASGLVGNHTEGTEPASGTYVTTDQTITPSAMSGKASLTREVWTRPGNPATASLVYNQMVRGYREGLEAAAATFLNTLTAATDITLGVGTTNGTLAANWEGALADLQFIRGYDFTLFVIEQRLYRAFAGAKDADGRALYPILGPSNANGTSRARFQTLDLAGVEGIPSWALTASAGALNNSWLIDPTTVYGWASAPERLEFPGTAPAGGGAYAPVAMVDLAIWGWKAFANTDIGGVRQVTYDETV